MKKQISVVGSKFCARFKPINSSQHISKLSFSVTLLFHFYSDFLLERKTLGTRLLLDLSL